MPPSEAQALDARLLAAHAAGDKGLIAVSYTQAADVAEAAGDVDQACFFLTQAWIFALEAGMPQARVLKKRLVAYGREIET